MKPKSGYLLFYIGKLCTVYEKHMKYFISDATVNKTWFKGELLDYLSNMEYKNIQMEDIFQKG